MKTLVVAILLAFTITAHAEITEKTVTMTCGTQEDFAQTAKKYKEIPILAAPNTESLVIYSLWANLETETTSWVIQFPTTNEWCMMGISNEIIIPDISPLSSAPIGTRIKFK